MPVTRRTFLVAVLSLATTKRVAADGLQLIMFDRAGCPWCAKWEAEVAPVYHKTWEGRRAPVRRVGMHPPYPPDLSFIRDIVYSPTFVLIKGGKEVGRIIGYPSEADFYVRLSQLIEKAGG